ncbi:PH domain-containing protein [Lentibacillus sp. N15]|uniref:PH domain-containing protein n=1 Tax=Lentibacillus songyuanensis TaxID=3136161 RepID=UPI0031BADEC4
MQPKRMHPMKIVFSFIKTIRNSFVVILYLFIINFNDVSTFIMIGRIVFLAFLLYRLAALTIEWWKTTYEFKNGTIHIYRGLFTRSDNRVPVERVQNVQWETPFYYRMFHLTALSLQTSAADKEASVVFEAIKQKDAEQIETLVLNKGATLEPQQASPDEFERSVGTQEFQVEETTDSKTIHFRPTRKDLWKASFLSFSFLAFIPILGTVYHQMDEVMNLDEQAKGLIAFLTSSWLMLGAFIIMFVIIAIVFGMTRTFLKYGKYEIASDRERIYIRSGTVSKSAFTVRKENVQAIRMNQNPLKKVLGLLEVSLLSAGSQEEESEEVHSLYPFLPQERAAGLIQELLPDFAIEQEEEMEKLPRTALFVRLLRIPWVWIIATILIVWLKPVWWWVSPIIFLLTYVMRVLDHRNTRFLLHEQFVQFKTGGLWSTVFITNRSKVIEAEVERTILQRRFSLATIQTINRTKPVHLEEIKDVPVETSNKFITWYHDRYKEIEVK